VEHEPSAGRGRVYVLGQAAKADPSLVKHGDRVDQVPQRPAETIKAPNHQRVTRPQMIKATLQLRPRLERARSSVDEHPRAAGACQRVALQIGVLLDRRHPGVADQVTHHPLTVSKPVDAKGIETLMSDMSFGRRRPRPQPGDSSSQKRSNTGRSV
jgi:hypothetical protein